MTGALQRARLPAESRAALVAKTTGYAARLLRRADQCRAVLACSHMHWQVGAALQGTPRAASLADHPHLWPQAQLRRQQGSRFLGCLQVAPPADEAAPSGEAAEQPAEPAADGASEPSAGKAPSEQAEAAQQPAAGLVQDAEEVMKCLKRAIKWAHAAQQQVGQAASSHA